LELLLGLADVRLGRLQRLGPARVERQVHAQERLRWRCGAAIVTADPPVNAMTR
jgi:hypothetical protein